MANRTLSKKRKPELDLDAEKTLYGAFTEAASAVSKLYSLGVQQQQKSRDAGAKQALERVASWVFSQYAGSAVVPTAALLEFLRQEMQDCTGHDADFPVAFPLSTSLPVLPGYGAQSSDENMLGDQAGMRRGTGGGMQISPPKRGSNQSLLHHQHPSQQQLYMVNQQQSHQQQQQPGSQQPHQQQCHGFFPGA